MRELTNEEKQDLYEKVTQGTAGIVSAITTLNRHELVQRQLDITTEVLAGLGIKAKFSADEVSEGLQKAAQPE